MDLTALIEFTAPGSIKSVGRALDGVEGDPWPGIDTWDADTYQDALDTLVVWAGPPPTGAAVHGNIAAYLASIPTPAERAAAKKALAVNDAFDLADMKTTVDGLWILISAMKTNGIPLGVSSLDALTNDAAGKAGFTDLWKQRFESHL